MVSLSVWCRQGALAVVAVVVMAGCTAGPSTPTEPSHTPASSGPSAASSPASGVPIADLEQAGAKAISVSGDWLSAGEGAVWLSGVTLIHRLDPKSGQPVAQVKVPQGPCEASVIAFRSLWTATCTKPGLARIDPATNRVSKHIPLDVAGDGEGSIGAGAGAVWILVDGNGCSGCRLAEVDRETMRVTRRIPVSAGAAGVRYGAGAVWVTNPAQNLLEQVDPHRGRVVRRIPVGPRPLFFAVGEGAVWTLNQGDGSVTRVDPATGKTTSIATDFVGDGGDATAGEGSVWLRGSSALLGRIDPKQGKVVQMYGPSSGSGAVIVGFDAVWISAHDVDTVWRLPLARA